MTRTELVVKLVLPYNLPVSVSNFVLYLALFRDNPGYMEDSKMTRTELVVNVVLPENLFVLALKDAAPETVRPRSSFF